MIAVWPVSGLGNRLRVISSFRVLARMAHRDFVVCWGPGGGFSDETLDDLFEHDLRLVTERDFAVLSKNALALHQIVQIRGSGEQRAWEWDPNYRFEQVFDPEFPVVTYRGVQRCDHLLPPERRFVLGDAFVTQYEEDVRTWRPVKRIRKAVDRVASGFGANTIGVHIRKGGAGDDTSPTTSYVPVDDAAFMAAMDCELEADPTASFYVATDAPDTERVLRERYGAAIMTGRKQRSVVGTAGRPEASARDVVIDLFALARTRRILGSHYSSLSEMAAVLGAIPHRAVSEAPDDVAVPDRIRLTRRPGAAREPRDTVAAWALNYVGMGHASRLTTVYEELRRVSNLASTLFVDEWKQLIHDYDFDQVVTPWFAGNLLERADRRPDSKGYRLARSIIDTALDGAKPVVLHDVFLYRPLYDAAVEGGWPQAFIYRDRVDVPDPAAWLRERAPAVSVVFWIGAPGLIREDDDIRSYGVENVVRRPLGETPLWGPEDGDLRVVVTAGGGGRSDCEAFLHAAMEALDAFSRRASQSVEVRVVTGPLYRGVLRLPAASPARFTVIRYVPPTHSLYWGSSVVVSQSGYNTFHEVGGSGIPHVLVPSVAFGADEQPRRAASVATEPDVAIAACDPPAIAEAVEHVLAAPRRDEWPTPAGADGARQIARAVAALAGVDV